MRVHPTELQSSNGRWQFGGAMMLIAFFALFMGYYLFSANNDTASAGMQRAKQVKVVVVQSQIELESQITEAMVGYQRMPASYLPADVVTELHKVVGQYSRIPLPIGAPIGSSLLSDTPVSADASNGDLVAPVDLIQQRLDAVYPTTVAVTLPFLTVPPMRGSRIAISIQGDAGRSVLVVDEAWVEKVEGNFAQVRVPSHMALYLEEAKSLGVFSSLVIPLEGNSPFAGQAVNDIIELRNKLVGANSSADLDTQAKAGETPEVEDFSSYAWIRGHDRVYAIDGEGKMHLINKQGQVSPLHPYKYQRPWGKTKVPGSSRVESGDGSRSKRQ